MSFNQLAPTVPTILNCSNCFVFSNSSTGNALSVQQLGAGNVFRFSNAAGLANVMVMNNLGQVGIGQTSPASGLILDVRATAGLIGDEKLGSTSGNQSNVIVQVGNGSSSTFGALKIIGNRTATGSDWVTTSLRIQKYVDATQMGYMEFGAPGGNQDIAFGSSGGTERMRITSAGNVGIGVTNPGAQLQIGGTGVTGNVLQIGSFTFQMVSYQALFATGTVTYTPSGSGIFVAFFASDAMVFTSSFTASGQYSAVTTYLNAATLTGNGGLGQLSLSTAVNGVLTATFKGTGDNMRVFRMAF